MLTNYLLEIGDIVKLWPEDMRRGYRRIHIDTVLLLEDANVNHTRSLLCEGMTLSLERAGLIVPKQTKLFSLVQSPLREILREKEVLLYSQRNIKRLQVQQEREGNRDGQIDSNIRHAERLIHSALNDQDSRHDLHTLFQHAHERLTQALKSFPQHYYAWLLLAWLQRCFIHDNEAAIQSYQQAIVHSDKHDTDFAVFARRHLADAFEAAGQWDKALAIAEQTYQLSDVDYLEVQYEYLRYLVLCECRSHTEIAPILGHLLRESLAYYPLIRLLQQQMMTDELQVLLDQFYQERISSLKMHIQMNWDKNPIHAIKLPESIDIHAIFQQQVEAHMPSLRRAAFMELDDEAVHVEKSILRVTRGRVASQINSVLEQYKQVIKRQEAQYKVLNRLGEGIFRLGLLVLIIVLGLGSYLLLQRLVYPGNLIMSIPWWLLLLLGSLSLASIGILLRNFQSAMVKSLRRKQTKMRELLVQLHKSIQ